MSHEELQALGTSIPSYFKEAIKMSTTHSNEVNTQDIELAKKSLRHIMGILKRMTMIGRIGSIHLSY